MQLNPSPCAAATALHEHRKYICETCGKAFKRSEHRARHQRAHTHEKPFSCQYCRRKYARQDLVVRHERTLHADRQASETQPGIVIATTASSTADSIEDMESIPIDDHSSDSVSAPAVTMSDKTGSSPAEHESNSTIVVNINLSEGAAPANVEAPGRTPMQTLLNPVPVPASTMPLSSLYDPSLEPNPMHHAYFSGDILDHIDLFNPFGSFTPFGDLELQQTTSIDAHMLLESRAHSPIQFSPDPIRAELGLPQANWDPEISVPSTLPTPPFSNGDHAKLTSKTNWGPPNLARINLPGILKTTHVLGRLPQFTEVHRARVALELEIQLDYGSVTHKDLPSARVLQRLLQTFVESHLIHLPFFHLPTLDFNTASAPLILAMCALGALYRLEGDLSARLYLQAEDLLTVGLRRSARRELPRTAFKVYEKPSSHLPQSEPHPIWPVQCRLMLTWFGAFTGNPSIAKAALTNIGLLLNDYRDRLSKVVCQSPGSDAMCCNWYQWVDREATKRSLLAILILCNMLTATYGIPPSISILRDGDIELPCEEALWNADSEAAWQQCLASSPTTVTLNLRTGVARLMNGSPDVEPLQPQLSWSPFTAVIILHAVAIHFWHVSQHLECFRLTSAVSPQNNNLQNLVLEHSAIALSRCKAHIMDARDVHDHLWPESEGPLLFNSLSVLRLIYLRAFAGDNSVNRGVLLESDMAKVRNALSDYVTSPQTRTLFTNKAARQIFEGIMTPSRAGSMLIRKTAALSWSLEIAISGWDGGMFFMKWLHNTEKLAKYDMLADISDRQLLKDIELSVAENDLIASDSLSLAANIGRHWAGYYDDTWSWGITPRFGLVLRELASVCQQDLEFPLLPTAGT